MAAISPPTLPVRSSVPGTRRFYKQANLTVAELSKDFKPSFGEPKGRRDELFAMCIARGAGSAIHGPVENGDGQTLKTLAVAETSMSQQGKLDGVAHEAVSTPNNNNCELDLDILEESNAPEPSSLVQRPELRNPQGACRHLTASRGHTEDSDLADSERHSVSVEFRRVARRRGLSKAAENVEESILEPPSEKFAEFLKMGSTPRITRLKIRADLVQSRGDGRSASFGTAVTTHGSAESETVVGARAGPPARAILRAAQQVQ
jgi:hypothetical protein